MMIALMRLCILFALQLPTANVQGQTDSGARCLYVAVRSLDKNVQTTFQQLSHRLPAADSVSLGQLQEQASTLGFQTLAVQTSLATLNHRQRPFACIAYLKRKDFVLITSSSSDIVVISDPPNVHRLPVATFLNEWDGDALLLAKSPIKSEQEIVSELWWSNTLIQSSVWIGPMFAVAVALVWWRKRRMTIGSHLAGAKANFHGR